MNTSHVSKRSLLVHRAALFAKTRAFFSDRAVLEVDTCLLSPFAPVDAHIDIMKVETGKDRFGYLHSSPEYAMKKLISSGSGDIYQLSHVFRKGEESPLHSPEFTMLEWYRLSLSYSELIEETFDLICTLIGEMPREKLTYREALIQFGGFDPATETHLLERVKEAGISLTEEGTGWDRDGLLSLLFSHLVEPHLGKDRLTAITSYPSTQAALAKKGLEGGFEVARRFEIYCNGIELANGYDELSDPKELKGRLQGENQKRILMGKESLPLDEEFIALTFPDCRGVAVGFDRVAMLARKGSSLYL